MMRVLIYSAVIIASLAILCPNSSSAAKSGECGYNGEIKSPDYYHKICADQELNPINFTIECSGHGSYGLWNCIMPLGGESYVCHSKNRQGDVTNQNVKLDVAREVSEKFWNATAAKLCPQKTR
jgi:hypothetical protein